MSTKLIGERLIKDLLVQGRYLNVLIKGVNEVEKYLSGDVHPEVGAVVCAENCEPPEVVSNVKLACEEKNIPIIPFKEKELLGWHLGIKRPLSCVLVKKVGEIELLLANIFHHLAF